MYLYFNILVLLFGLIIGSFLNVVILRLEKSEKLGGRSYCPHCKHSLMWMDLIPVFSFLFLRAKCRYCSQEISWQYPLVEVVTGLIFLLVFNFSGLAWNDPPDDFLKLIFWFYIASVLIVIFVYDLKHYLIPDKILFPAIIIAFLCRILEFFYVEILDEYKPFSQILRSFGEFGSLPPLAYYLLATIIASGFFLCIYMVSKGKWMGFGDVKLAILLGLILGFPNILAGLFLAFFSGAIIGVALMLIDKKGLKSELPFAPFLILGTFLAMFWGQQLINWYTGLFSFYV
ncbi:MAG: prepilin peptidase [Candidatus Staskawiczbacteria bacterium]|nr:prepilin peptidase [Candidatus Staskawiczbacteria bacterium]